jgi:hypothetical protein
MGPYRVSIVSPSKPTTASVVAAVVDGAVIVDGAALVEGATVVDGVALNPGAAVPVVADVVAGAAVVVAVAAVVAMGAASPGIAELAWVPVPAKKYTSPLVVAQLATNAPIRAPRAGWRRRLRVFTGPGGVTCACELDSAWTGPDIGAWTDRPAFARLCRAANRSRRWRSTSSIGGEACSAAPGESATGGGRARSGGVRPTRSANRSGCSSSGSPMGGRDCSAIR